MIRTATGRADSFGVGVRVGANHTFGFSSIIGTTNVVITITIAAIVGIACIFFL